MHTFFNRISPAQILREAEGEGGGGGGDDRFAEVNLPDDVVKGLRSLVNKEGGDAKALATLYEENYELRKDKRELQDKIDNGRVLTEEEAEKWDKYQELGEDPEKLEEKIENAESAQQELSKLKREKQHSEVADVYEWNPKVLNRLSDEDAEYEIKTRKNDEGEDEQYAVIKTEDGEKDLQEYAQENWDDMMPALKTNGQSNEEEESSNEKKFSKQKSSSDSKKNEDGYLSKWKENNKKAAGLASEEDK